LVVKTFDTKVGIKMKNFENIFFNKLCDYIMLS